MSEEQGVEAVEVETETVETEEVETEEVEEQGEETETEETEEVEVDYKVESEKLQKTQERDQKKINNQRKALSEQNKQIQAFNAQLAELKKQNVEKEPTVDDFETFEEYDAARVEYITKQATQEASATVVKQQREQAILQRQTAQKQEFDKAEVLYRAKNPEYDTAKESLLAHAQIFPLPQPVISAMEEQARDEGMLPDVLAYYGSNLDEFDALQDKSPMQAAIEVYKVSQRLKVEKPKTKPLPKPIKSIKGTAGTKKALGKMSYEELKKTIYKE